MQEKNLIMEDNREYYQYAMELLVEESLTVGTILVVNCPLCQGHFELV